MPGVKPELEEQIIYSTSPRWNGVKYKGRINIMQKHLSDAINPCLYKRDTSGN